MDATTIPPTQPVAPPGPSRVFLGGGGWRGAFGSIGALAYLIDHEWWGEVDDVVAISGGSFAAAMLGAETATDRPMEVLGCVTNRLLDMRWPVRRRLASFAAMAPFVVVPPLFLLAARAMAGTMWTRLLRANFPERPSTGRGPRILIGAAGLSSAQRYVFVSGDTERTGDVRATRVPDGWRVSDAIAAATALPGLRGYRVAGEVLVDGGLLGIFGTQTFERWPSLTAADGLPRTLIVDAGRRHRPGNPLVEWCTQLSTTLLLGRWIKVGLDGAFRRALLDADPTLPLTDSTTPLTRLVRLAEDDGSAPTDREIAKRLRAGRTAVRRFGLLGLNRRNAETTLVVAIVACAVEYKPSIEPKAVVELLRSVGAGMSVGGSLADRWNRL